MSTQWRSADPCMAHGNSSWPHRKRVSVFLFSDKSSTGLWTCSSSVQSLTSPSCGAIHNESYWQLGEFPICAPIHKCGVDHPESVSISILSALDIRSPSESVHFPSPAMWWDRQNSNPPPPDREVSGSVLHYLGYKWMNNFIQAALP